ncbi:aspartate aminotransferase family protein [Pseudomonas aeruginosa]|uniref:aspartate aminotransferase family protein n=1 Tax=Pseudomonas aeruginosa TaxID=287 RepID=UPI000B48C10C|nr:aspartate aminotransferase family protein [Pseudomonas aeruginosa]MCU9105296.1 aspartate aminotransferase family protein [Pseudomonas aeruginosa]MCU9249772.1 aspartate aminotransferase family protein [Pseudomonas aeruginosa]MCU9304563.1 aspartate aminotransferase family protein [Pseudomonas aeruginosa]MCU9510328.1 aspartate aminotransferase family protein [Pseudomonas aeruginosa]OWJ21460.1 aspartate aminotransferase family protein [Pseudomonas aeruginosa]
MNKTNLTLEQKDVKHHLHPYTDARLHESTGPLIIERGEGIHVFDTQGKKYIEAMSGLWSVALGFSNQRLIEAAEKQLRTLPFYHLFTSKAHVPSIELAEKLVEMAPVPMSKVFFTNSGSEANDTVVKLLWYRNNALGLRGKKKFISRANAYHGITAVSASLTGLPANQRGFDVPLPGFLHVSCPHFYRYGKPGETEELFADRLAQELDELIIKEGAESVAAFYAEPLMGAGGVIVPPATYWEKIQKVCRKHDILIVADEVICGFGRTGNMFGSETFGIKPDVMVLSKQLSSSYQPIAAILINERIYQDIAEQSHAIGTLGHGFTGSGHPVASAVALENLKIIQEENLVRHAARMGEILQGGLRAFTGHPLVGEVRGVGLIAAVELVADKATKAPFDTVGRLGRYLAARAQDLGMISRAMGDAVAFCPPLISSEEDIQAILRCFEQALEDTWQWFQASQEK